MGSTISDNTTANTPANTQANPDAHAVERDAEAWLDRFFTAFYEHHPVDASFIGVDGHDHRLPDYSESSTGDFLADAHSLLDDSRQLLARSEAEPSVPAHTRLDVQLARAHLELRSWEYGSQHFHRGNPSLHVGESVFGIMSPFLARAQAPEHRVDSAVQRMRSIPEFLRRARAIVETAPADWLQRAMDECDGAMAFLRGGWRSLPELEVAPDGLAAMEEASRVAAGAFADHQTALGAIQPMSGSRSCGEEAFARYLRQGHFLDETPPDIAAYAREELDRAQSALAQGRLSGAQPNGTVPDLASIHPSIGDYLGRYQELWDEVRTISDRHDLAQWPDQPVAYLPRPEWAREAAPHLYFLFYRAPAAYSAPAVHHYLVTPIDSTASVEEQEQLLRANNDSVIKLNHVVHHGSIGHHVQNGYAARSASRVGRVAGVDGACRIAMFSGLTMTEGWACYATDLMSELGFLTDGESVAELRSRVRMCARAIVDVHLHTRGWTLEQGAAFYMAEAGMPEAAARREAIKNSMFPAAALIYLVGTDAIHALRKEAESGWGSSFTLRRFHDALLRFGSIPVALAAKEMRRQWS